MRQSLTCWAGVILTCCTGCSVIITQMKDERDDFTIHRTNHYLAVQAWKEVKDCYFDIPCPHDFELGFKRGYRDRASGLNGCPPALPPRRYWRAKLMGEKGVTRANSWFDGYRHGVVVAEQDGVADLARVPSSVPYVDRTPEPPEAREKVPPTELQPEEFLNGSPGHEVGPLPNPLGGEAPSETPEPGVPNPVAAPTNAPLYDEPAPEDSFQTPPENSINPVTPVGPGPESPVPPNVEPPSDPPRLDDPPPEAGKVDF